MALLPSTIALSWTAITPTNCTNVVYSLYAASGYGFPPSRSNEIVVGLAGTSFVNNKTSNHATWSGRSCQRRGADPARWSKRIFPEARKPDLGPQNMRFDRKK